MEFKTLCKCYTLKDWRTLATHKMILLSVIGSCGMHQNGRGLFLYQNPCCKPWETIKSLEYDPNKNFKTGFFLVRTYKQVKHKKSGNMLIFTPNISKWIICSLAIPIHPKWFGTAAGYFLVMCGFHFLKDNPGRLSADPWCYHRNLVKWLTALVNHRIIPIYQLANL